jgi:uncharacterized membrane protein YidH (DUF202 family)
MFNFFEIATFRTFLLGIPESVGLLAFGIGLTATAVFIRWFLGRNEIGKTEGKRR